MVDFSSWETYIYPVVAIGSIVIIVYAVKLFSLSRKNKLEPTAPQGGTPIPTEEELKSMLKDLGDKKKLDALATKEAEKARKVEVEQVKKVEAKLVASMKVKKVKKVEDPKDFKILSEPQEVSDPDTPQIEFKLKKFIPKFSYDRIKTWYLDRYHPGRVVLINMELTNGFHKLFMVKEKDEGFVFRSKKYLFDDDSKYYNLDTKLYTFDFHEQIVLPFKRKIPVTEIKKTIESTEGIDIEYAINPSTLQRFMTAKIAEGVMRGTQLDEFMKKLQTFLIVTMITSLVHLAIFLYASGLLQNIKVPGIVG